MIVIRELVKRYDDKVVLDHVNLTLKVGEFAFLQGKSGCGKTTLLKLLYKEVTDFTGSIHIDGISIDELPKYELRRKMGIIFQSFQLLERKTVMENVLLAGEVLGKDLHDIQPEAVRLLKRVGLAEQHHHYPHQLSGGEQQRVAIVRALLNRPKLLLADEPTGNLDPETAWDIMNLLNEINARGTTVVMATHAKDIVDKMKKRVIHIDKGIIVRDDKKGGYNSGV